MKLFEFDGNWTTDYQFEAFQGLQNRRGAYTSKSSNKKSDGTISLTINDNTSKSPDPSQHQINAINYLIKHPEEVKLAMRKGIDSIYEDLKKQYGYDENESDTKDWFPKIDELSDYDKVFGVGNVFIQLPSKDEHSYVGIECGCTWDEEHGLGFLFHKNRLIGIGGADEAFSWKDYKDNGTFEEVQKELKQNSNKEPIKYEPHPKYGKLKPSQKSANEAYESNLIRRKFNKKFITEVEQGKIDINGIYTSIDQSYLELAISSKNLELVNYLLNRGSKIRYAFHQTRKDINLIDTLITKNGDINTKDKEGNTIIYQATKELVTLYDHRNQSKKYNWNREEELSNKVIEQNEYIKKLLIRGANPSIENTYKFNCFNAARNLPDDQQQEINSLINKNLKLESPKSNKGNRENKNDKWWKFW